MRNQEVREEKDADFEPQKKKVTRQSYQTMETNLHRVKNEVQMMNMVYLQYRERADYLAQWKKDIENQCRVQKLKHGPYTNQYYNYMKYKENKSKVQELFIEKYIQEKRVLQKMRERQKIFDQAKKRNIQVIQQLQQAQREYQFWNQNSQKKLKKVKSYCRIKPTKQQNNTIVLRKDPNRLVFFNEQYRSNTDNVIEQVPFWFQQIFTQKDDQQSVFEPLKKIIPSLLTDANIVFFACGQTGSGKTYSLFGDKNNGIISLSIIAIFQLLRDNKCNNSKAYLQIQQVYLNKIKDLISNQEYAKFESAKFERHQCCNQIDAIDYLLKMTQKRKKASTGQNDSSSRSHLIMKIKVLKNISQVAQSSQIIFLDLAGNENYKISQSHQSSKQLEEMNWINTSLLALTTILVQINNNEKAISFRANMLTKYIQPYMGENNQTYMLFTISANKENKSQTKCTLDLSQIVAYKKKQDPL